MYYGGGEKVVFQTEGFFHVLALNIAAKFEPDEDIPF
jgi:hypothetical protein